MATSAAVSLQRWGAHLASRHPNLQLSALPSLRCLSLVAATPLHVITGAGNTDAALNCPRRRPAAAHRRSRSPLALAASYSLVTGGPPGSGDGSSGGGGPVRLIVYSREGCHLCDGLKEKLEALLERAAFLPSALSGAELEVRDITSRPEWEAAYAMTIPVLAAAAPDGSGEVEVPRPSPRLSADALQRHIEKFLAAQRGGGQ